MVVNEFLSQHPDYRLVAAGEVLGKIGFVETGDFWLSPSGAVTVFAAVLERTLQSDPN
jgi:hypothetical protein